MKTTQLLDFGSNILRSKKIISHRIDSEVILSYILKISREKLLIKEDKICNENIIKFKSLIFLLIITGLPLFPMFFLDLKRCMSSTKLLLSKYVIANGSRSSLK